MDYMDMQQGAKNKENGIIMRYDIIGLYCFGKKKWMSLNFKNAAWEKP